MLLLFIVSHNIFGALAAAAATKTRFGDISFQSSLMPLLRPSLELLLLALALLLQWQ